MDKKFSERLGLVDNNQQIQIDSMNNELRNSIWNFIYLEFENKSAAWENLAKSIAQGFRKTPLDELPYSNYDCREWIKSYFYHLEWFKVYDLIEFIVANNNNIYRNKPLSTKSMVAFYNRIFEQELSGYRFISNVLAPITTPVETSEISNAIQTTLANDLAGASKHLQTSLSLLSKKPQADYRNSIKESISAVESVAKILSGSNSQGLAGAISKLEQKVEIHGSLKSGFNKLYGYSSDEDGIRHAILDVSNVGFDEAKYMLVSCSAFVNFLISKANSTGIID